MNPQNQQSLDPTLVDLAKAIRQTESQNNYTIHGKSGEYGAYQFTPDTWAAKAATAGVNAPLEQASPAQQNEVAYKTLAAWKTQHPDWNVGNFASAWNAGEGRPNAYQEGNVGVNQYGASYDTGAYAKKVAEHYQEFKAQRGGQVAGGNQPAPQPSFLQEAGNDVAGALGGASNALGSAASGQINPVSGLIQGVGSLAGGVTSLANTAATHLPVVGGLVKGAEDLLGQGVQAAANTAPGQAVVGAAQGFAKEHPELAGDIGGAANIAGVVPLLKAPGLIAGAVGKAAASGALGETVAGLSDKAAMNEALDLVSPQATKATVKKGILSGRGNVSGVSKTVGMAPDFSTQQAADALKDLVKIGVVGSEKTAVENANAVLSEISKEAEQLKTSLASQEIKPIVTADDLGNLKQTMQQQAEDSFTLVGNASLYGDRAVKKFFSLLPTGRDVTAEDLLEARQGLDRWAKGNRGAKIFDPATASAQAEGLRIVRRSVNDLIAEKAPSIGVKESLKRQSALYDALDAIASKGAKEVGTNRFQRFAKRHPHISRGVLHAGEGLATGVGLKQTGLLDYFLH